MRAGWLDGEALIIIVGGAVLASRGDQPNATSCSLTCLALFSAADCSAGPPGQRKLQGRRQWGSVEIN